MPFSNGFLLSLSLCLDIGIANIAMITLAMQRGFLQGFWLGLGTCVGDLLYAVAALAGMTVLLQFETVRWVLWLGGSVLLVWFAVKMLLAAWRGEGHVQAGEVVVESSWREFLRGIFLAMSSQCDPLVRGGRRCADFALRWWQLDGGRAVPFWILCRRTALVPVALPDCQSRWAAAR